MKFKELGYTIDLDRNTEFATDTSIPSNCSIANTLMANTHMVRSRTDYLLGTDGSLFKNVSVRDPRHNTDHFMVVGCLRSAPAREQARYIKGRRKMPLSPPTEPTREGGIFEALRRAVPKPHKREKHKNAWISEETWRLVDERVSARRGTGVQVRIQRLGRSIRASLQGDRKRKVDRGDGCGFTTGRRAAKP